VGAADLYHEMQYTDSLTDAVLDQYTEDPHDV
jgi:hypothetical protein